MMKKLGAETKVGLFALLCIAIIAFATVKLGGSTFLSGSGYAVTVTMDNAIGIKKKTPVEVAGIQIGIVRKIKLHKDGKAQVVLRIDKGIRIPEGTKAFVRAKGFLGQTFVELRYGPTENAALAPEAEIPYGGVTGDVNMLLTQFNEIAGDIKTVTGSLKDLVGEDKSSPVYRAVYNIDEFSKVMRDISVQNQDNMNKIIANLADLTAELRGVVERRRTDIEASLANISNITRKVDEGKGTIGRLVNDDTTVTKLNEAVDSLSDALGGLKRLETEIGYHGEYLTRTTDFKHYVHLNLMPTPDKGFMFEFVGDPKPTPLQVERDISITAGGATTNVSTNTNTIEHQKFRFSAMLAKKFYDFRFRGGVIESTGGVGMDYLKGPLGLHFSAFDFDTTNGRKPHLKAHAALNMVKGFYIVGGADDFINPFQPVDWFVGGGLRLVDDDIKSLLGFAGRTVR